ncbi:hypothetical protein BDV96DRAFT_588070 [Lophiotrema nucula]|uniref:F5/8 type C domain-containing protein n=1 Tax=Lophiotrema nucula TaxID=690887 RepID=A0A6A5YMT0_9PLEO|nr:hypothetical protein BDV96DRAFT_588070 [Lophiotrema nucula]
MAAINFFSLLFFSFVHTVFSASIAINRAGWTITSDSYQPGMEAAKAFDSDVASFWHSAYKPTLDPLPNVITIDMKSTYVVNGVSIQPRQDNSMNGNIGQHTIELSADGTNWGLFVANGRYVNDKTTKKTTFVARQARYVRITALTEAQSSANQWTSAAEINVYADVQYTSRSAWTVSADTAETTKAQNGPANAIDGSTATIWHTKYSGTIAPLPHWFQIDQSSLQTVSALSYLPRTDSANGRIGKYTVQASNDSTTWTQVSSGTWADDGNEKTAQFTTATVTARYFRLNALSEAGNRGQWSSASEINLVSLNSASFTAPPPSKGFWQNTVDFPIVPAAAAVLPNGKVLLWSAYLLDYYGGTNGYTQTAIYDPTTGVVTPRNVTNTAHDMFCPGISMTFDGKIVVTGGDDAAKTSIYDPVADAWIAGPNMKISRGYQSTATVSDGKVFNIGGSWSGGKGNKNGEIYNPTTKAWSLIQNALVSPMLTADAGGIYRADNHGWFFAWKNQTVLQAGPSKAMNWYETDGVGMTTGAGNRADDGDAMCGNAVMYDATAGKILSAGGASSYQTVDARSNAYLITIGQTLDFPAVVKAPSMAYARGFANGVALPDGTVFVTGGQSHVEPFTDTTAIYTPELYDPTTNTWTQLNPHAIPRTYHSVALLLQDGTVFTGGGGLCGNCATNHWDGEIFVPPYLLNLDGSRRTRPVINSVVSTATIGSTITVTTNGLLHKFALVRFGTATHTVNTDQRRIPLTALSVGTSYTITIPGDPGVALPGYWYLFAMDQAGTPSIAKIILLSP